MKNSMLGLVVGMAMVSQLASATSLRPVRALEAVQVKSIVLKGDFMPPLPPGGMTPFTEITAQVDTNGCTSADDFRVQVRQVAAGQEVTLVRVRPDRCKAYFPEGTEILVSTRNVQFGSPVFLANPVRLIDQTTH